MKNFLGRICFMFARANMVHIIWLALVLLTMLMLAILHHRWRYYENELKLWKKLCFIPLLITTVHYFIYISGFPDFMNNYTPMYLTAVIALLPMLCAGNQKAYKVISTICGVLTVIFSIHFLNSMNNPHNFSRMSYTRSFHALVREMDRSYVLKEWKEIDFNALEAKYMPLVKNAEQENDPAKFADTVTKFCNELHDEHIFVAENYDHEKYPPTQILRDHGLSMVQLDNGEVIAVCTDVSVHKLGIKDGTVITKWNGKPILQAAEEDVPDQGVPVKANGDRLALFDLAACGTETVDVTFNDSSGKEKTVSLPAIENKHTLDDAYNAFLHIPEHRSEMYSSNFSTKMLNDKCGYLLLCAETTGGSLSDAIAFFKGESRDSMEMFRKKLRKLKDQGMEYLVIDLRNNMGGYDEIGCALCGLLTDEDRYAVGVGYRKNGKYIRTAYHNVRGDGEFADLNVVALTNLNCVSAGDVTAALLSKLPNVTLAGITDPNGSGQMTGGICALSKGEVVVSYPVGLTINENGEPDTDPRADRISRDPVEVRIPLDYEAAMKIFRDKKDYELDWAVKYLENTSE
ncbi:MAG: hypothetical protein K6G33_06625 [Ruminococcus sp.]|uniref:S41 family peptidase n=1 Tax=Ruminococcus sp. TaxID=41978 RepID=UPI0025D3048D|nr:S41 family peptidase [Ruminococcus sp.]MCR5600393.1 hypothetical protein [Ruminococcus sp.]